MLRRILLFSFLVCVLTLPLTASVLIKLNLAQLTDKADSIIVGEVLDMTSRWAVNKWGDELIYTDVTVSVTDTIKGIASYILTVTVEGGRVGDVELISTHMPRFTKGEKAVLFLKNEDDEVAVYAGIQGRLSIDENGVIRERSISVGDLKLQIKNLLAK